MTRQGNAARYQSQNNIPQEYPNNSRDPPPQYQATRDGYQIFSQQGFDSQQCSSDGAAKN